MQEIIRQYQALPDEELIFLYQNHQHLKVADFTALMLEMSRRKLNERLFTSPEEQCTGEPTEQTLCEPERPRAHHYIFVHRVLRDKVFYDPLCFFEKLHHGSIENYLYSFWLTTWFSIPEEHQNPFVKPDGFHVSPLEQIGDLYLATVTFPIPIYMTEAYFAAIVFNRDASIRRYFTLEFTEADDGTPLLPVVCEWEEGIHRNSGNHLLPSREDFAAYVRKIVVSET
jgi:hypothetical protein